MKNKNIRSGFTLIELLVVIAIMGMMGTASVSSYRALRQGMEEKAVHQNASQFLRLAYYRSRIDFTPVYVYYWNETRQIETEDSELLVVGRAVAVRRNGRISHVEGNRKLYDEFGDFESLRFVNEDGDIDDSAAEGVDAKGLALYRLCGDRDPRRCMVSPYSVFKKDQPGMASYPVTADEDSAQKASRNDAIRRFGLVVRDPGNAGQWKVGDAYGFEFAEIELPQGYLFGSGATFDKNQLSDGFTAKGMRYDPMGDAADRLELCVLRPNKMGVLEKIAFDKTEDPADSQDKQNQ